MRSKLVKKSENFRGDLISTVNHILVNKKKILILSRVLTRKQFVHWLNMEDVNILCRICLRPDREKSHQSVFHTKLQIPSKIFLLSGVQVCCDCYCEEGRLRIEYNFQVVECRNNPALICNQCVDDLVFADSIRKRCIEADEHFRSTIPKKFFSRGIDVTIRDNSWNKPSASHFSIVEVQGIIEKKSEQESEDEFLATFIKSEKQSEEESNDDQFSRQFRSSVYKPNTFGAVSRKLLKKHEDNDQTGDKSMRHCDLCEYQTVHKRHMIRHCQVHSSEIFDFRQRESPTQRRLEVDPANLVNCKYCKKPFKNSLLLDRHIKGSHNDRT